jgi:hypothetical protein
LKYELSETIYEEAKKKYLDELNSETGGDDKPMNEKGIKEAFIVFKSMKGAELIKKAYNYKWKYRKFVTLFKFYFDKRYEEMEKRMFYGIWPDVSVPDLPDNI